MISFKTFYYRFKHSLKPVELEEEMYAEDERDIKRISRNKSLQEQYRDAYYSMEDSY